MDDAYVRVWGAWAHVCGAIAVCAGEDVKEKEDRRMNTERERERERERRRGWEGERQRERERERGGELGKVRGGKGGER